MDLDKLKDNDEIVEKIKILYEIDDDQINNLFLNANISLGDMVELTLLLKRNPDTLHKSIIRNFFNTSKVRKDAFNEIINEQVTSSTQQNQQTITPLQAKQHIDNLTRLSKVPNSKVNIDDETGTKTVTKDIVGTTFDDSDKKDKAVVKDPISKDIDIVDISKVKEIK